MNKECDIVSGQSFTWYDNDRESVDRIAFCGEGEDFPLFDETDILILMHRDVHFSGSFSAMLAYYENESAKGVHREIAYDRIRVLESIQRGWGRDLSPLCISGRDAERVAQARRAYARFSELANSATAEGAIASAILSEEDECVSIDDLASKVIGAERFLLGLVEEDALYDSLFPGYGFAPQLAIALLGKLRYEPALSTLFCRVCQTDFETEDVVLDALRAIGDPAKELSLRKVVAQPCSQENVRAALVLSRFLPDVDIENTCKEFLPHVQDETIRAYLLALLSDG